MAPAWLTARRKGVLSGVVVVAGVVAASLLA